MSGPFALRHGVVICYLVLLTATPLFAAGPTRQIPKPSSLSTFKKALASIGTGSGDATLQAAQDAQLFKRATVTKVVTAILDLLDSTGLDVDAWEAVPDYAQALPRYLKQQGLDDALQAFRDVASGKDLVEAVVQLTEFVAKFDPHEFVEWAITSGQSMDKEDLQITSTTPSTFRSTGRPQKQLSWKPRSSGSHPHQASTAARKAPQSPPKKTSQKSPARPKSPAKPKSPKRPDLNDPIQQLADWVVRAESLGGSLAYKEEGPARRRRQLLHDAASNGHRGQVDVFVELDQAVKGRGEVDVEDAAVDGGVLLRGRRTLQTGAGATAANPNLNVGSKSFKARRIGIVFHALQFTDSKNFLYPPMAYWYGDEPARRMINHVNQMYRYSGANIQFYLKDYRVDTRKFPYLNLGSLDDWQECGNDKVLCTCDLAKRNNVDSSKYINVYVAGSSAYRGLSMSTAAAAVTSAIPPYNDLCDWTVKKNWTLKWDQKFSPKGQHIWLLFDEFDPLYGNSADAYNSGGTTLGHEIGHMLGLWHTFSHETDPKKACRDPDMVVDTPPEIQIDDLALRRRLAAVCSNMAEDEELPLREDLLGFDTCKSDKYVNNLFNIMSYNPRQCMLFFSRGQVQRMQAVAQKFQTKLGS